MPKPHALLTSMEHSLNLHIRIANGSTVLLGPGRADLLEHIETEGSIAGAGRRMKMSYKRAWALVEAMNAAFNAPLVAAAKGGAGGGGAKLTTQGAEVLAAYREMEAAARKSSGRFLTRINAVRAVPPKPDTG